jgi:excisionase family DNA binding protein
MPENTTHFRDQAPERFRQNERLRGITTLNRGHRGVGLCGDARSRQASALRADPAGADGLDGDLDVAGPGSYRMAAATDDPDTRLPPATPWLTVRQAAAYIQTGPKVVYRAIAAGHLRAARIGARRDIRVRREWVNEYVECCADDTLRR